MSFTDEQIQSVWEKGQVVPDCNKNEWRKDSCGAWIYRADYGDRTATYGWEIDHVYPKDKLKEKKIPQSKWDEMPNLRPMHWENNNSKDNDYPTYTAAKTSKGNANIEVTISKVVADSVQRALKKLYNI